jgi:hypothetical protein
MTTSTMITIRTMVPMPINMGFLSDAHRPRGPKLVYLARPALGALAVCPGPCLGDTDREPHQLLLEDVLGRPSIDSPVLAG